MNNLHDSARSQYNKNVWKTDFCFANILTRENDNILNFFERCAVESSTKMYERKSLLACSDDFSRWLKVKTA